MTTLTSISLPSISRIATVSSHMPPVADASSLIGDQLWQEEIDQLCRLIQSNVMGSTLLAYGSISLIVSSILPSWMEWIINLGVIAHMSLDSRFFT